jgi:hypothetical protein
MSRIQADRDVYVPAPARRGTWLSRRHQERVHGRVHGVAHDHDLRLAVPCDSQLGEHQSVGASARSVSATASARPPCIHPTRVAQGRGSCRRGAHQEVDVHAATGRLPPRRAAGLRGGALTPFASSTRRDGLARLARPRTREQPTAKSMSRSRRPVGCTWVTAWTDSRKRVRVGRRSRIGHSTR